MGSSSWAVLVTSLAGSSFMAPCGKVLFVFLVGGHCILGARQLRNPAAARRDGKSLVGTFPFSANACEDEHHHGRHEEHAENSVTARDQRQGEDADTSFRAVAAAGKKCIDKVEMVEETEYDDVVQCDHSYDKRCHTTYVTNYESQQVEECEENYRTPLVKDCDVQGPEICRTEYGSECWTKQEVHDVEDDVVECTTEVEEKCEDETSGYTTNTKCSKWPKEVCSVS